MTRVNTRQITLAVAALIVATPALAQTPPQPKAVQTVPVRPAAQTPADTFRAMTAQERQAIQSDLAWASLYNGVVDGEFNDRVIVAIRAYQQRTGARQTGVLNPQERATLAAEAKKLQDNAGWRIVDDMVSGGKVGIPTKLVPQVTANATSMKWASAQGQVQIESWRVREPDITTRHRRRA